MGDDLGQYRNGGWRAVHIAPAMVGDDDGVGAALHGHLRIVHAHHALDDELARPDVAQPVNVLPGHFVSAHGGGVTSGAFAASRHPHLVFFGIIHMLGHAPAHHVAAHHGRQPFGMFQHINDAAGVELVGLREAVARIVLAIGAMADVHRPHQSLKARFGGAAHQLVG